MHSSSQLSNKLPVKNENEPLFLSITTHALNLWDLTTDLESRPPNPDW